jgi:hypothetical protein
VIVKDKSIIFAIIVAIFLLCNNSSVYANDKYLYGTYTDLYYEKKGGDLLGHELKIVLTRKGLQGALQFADGGPSELVLVDIIIDNGQIFFSIPDGFAEAGHFKGVIDRSKIKGKFMYKTGAEETVYMKKGLSYWDKEK